MTVNERAVELLIEVDFLLTKRTLNMTEYLTVIEKIGQCLMILKHGRLDAARWRRDAEK